MAGGFRVVSDPSDTAAPAGVTSIVGASDWTANIRRDILSLARHSSSVLITGPNGTGKEILARAIHAHSPRKDQPFIPVDCAAFVGALFPSHMFGHVKGAFTGAQYEAIGCFRAAHGGSLFLDEIGELEPGLQAKLLRVLQERVVVPVGGVQGIPVDVRLICATNRDLQSEVGRGNFRQRLFYRLNVVQLRTSPLRDRQADILILAEHFLKSMAAETGMPRKQLAPAAQELLTAYPWPGNVRQLRNLLERAVVYAEQEQITAVLLARLLYEEEPQRGDNSSPEPANSSAQESAAASLLSPESAAQLLAQYEAVRAETARQNRWVSLDELERFHIAQTLQYTFYNQSAAARLLQTTPRILAGKIKKYGIDVSLSHRGRPTKSDSTRLPR